MSLTTTELSAMRTHANSYLPDTCTILRGTASHTASGVPKLSYGTASTGVACRMDEPISAAGEGEANERVGVVVRWPMHFKYDADIRVIDRVIFGGSTYEVNEVLDSASWLITRRVMVSRLE